MNKATIKATALDLTQRLDHMVPDPALTNAANQKAAADLASLAAKLFWHVPDPSLSPLERLERLARAADRVKPDLSQLQSASKKVAALRKRIDRLVPGRLSPERKIEQLVKKLDRKVGRSQAHLPTADKLELLGDPRSRVAPEVRRVRRRQTRRR